MNTPVQTSSGLESLRPGRGGRPPWAALLALLACAWTNTGQTAAPDHALSQAVLPDSGVSLLRVSGALALVVGLFLGGVWLFKNWQRVLLKNKGAPKLNVIEVRSLGGRHALYLIGYDQQRMLLAASPAGIQFITHLPDAEADPSGALPGPVFSGVLDRTRAAAAEVSSGEAT